MTSEVAMDMIGLLALMAFALWMMARGIRMMGGK